MIAAIKIEVVTVANSTAMYSRTRPRAIAASNRQPIAASRCNQPGTSSSLAGGPATSVMIPSTPLRHGLERGVHGSLPCRRRPSERSPIHPEPAWIALHPVEAYLDDQRDDRRSDDPCRGCRR